MSQMVEIGRFRVSQDHAASFVEARPKVDEALKSLAGFLGSELIQVSDEEWLLMVYWESKEAVVSAQAVTRNMVIISDWIGIASNVLSFDTSELVYTSVQRS